MESRTGTLTGGLIVSAALHAALAAWLAWTPALPSARPTKGARDVEVLLLPPAEDSAFPGLQPVDRTTPGWTGGDGLQGRIAGADIDRIGARLAVLFPFVIPGLALEAFFPSMASPSRLHFENPFARPAARTPPEAARPLAMDDTAMQALVDRSWTRARRWAAFATIHGIVQAHGADDPRVARLVGLYREQNALQPYADGSVRDLRLWAQLGLAADHVSFIGFVRDVAAAHPHTLVATELLLLLDTLAQANQDALAVLVETNQVGDMEWTKETHPRAYLLARQIRRQYGAELARRGLTTRAAIDNFYARGRLAFLAGVLETTPRGYRANDIRFLMGEILWKQGRAAEAVQVWRELAAPRDDSYAAAIAQLRAAVRSAAPDARNINHILGNQQGRWLSFSDDRLRRFGYRADSY